MEAARTTSPEALSISSIKLEGIGTDGDNNDGGNKDKVAETAANFDFKDLRNGSGSSPTRDFVGDVIAEHRDNEKASGMTLIDEDYKKLKDKLDEYKCPICMEILVKTSMISCGHRFCLYCIKQWFHHSFPRRFCPVCRKNCIYYQDDGDTDVNISNMYHCLPLAEQEERNMILMDREYLSTLPLPRMPEQSMYFEGFVDELSQSWASQNWADFIGGPSEFEPMNPIMPDSYYPPFQHYASYEPPFTGYQDRSNGSAMTLMTSAATDPPQPSSTADSMGFHQGNTNYLPSPPTLPTTNASQGHGTLDLNYNRGEYLLPPSSQSLAPPPPGALGPYGYMGEGYLPNGVDVGQPNGLNANLEYSPDPNNIGLWNSQNFDQNSANNLPYDSMTHVPDHTMGSTYDNYSDVRDAHVPFRLSGVSSVGWNNCCQNPLNTDWQLMNAQQVDNWGFSTSSGTSFPGSLPATITATSDYAYCSRTGGTKSSKKLFHPQNVVTTHEDYQQDVLIQEEFQRLDEMLLRDDDEEVAGLSDVDQVSVESVVSSEQQYDSPWENGTEQHNKEEEGKVNEISDDRQEDAALPMSVSPKSCGKQSETLSNGSPPGNGRTAPLAAESELSRDNNSVCTAASCTQAAADEFLQNFDHVIMNAKQRVEDRKSPAAYSRPQQQSLSPPQKMTKSALTPARTSTTATTTTTTETLAQTSLLEQAKKPIRLKTAAATFEIVQQQPPHQLQQQRRYMDGTQPLQPPRILESKRTLERIRMDEIRITERSAVQNFKPYQPPVESLHGPPGPMPPLDFRSSAPLTLRRTTPRLPRIRMETSHKRHPQTPPQILKRKPQNSMSPSTPPSSTAVTSVLEPVVPPVRNMMGVSQGDGVWGPIPEMNARMYLPHGVLVFKMEYQPNGNSAHAFSPRKQQQQHSQQQQQQQSSQQRPQPVLTNLAKFTHPVIHMLPLSSDGSTRLNVTFDVIYQN